jgi:hypothetical protein
LRKTFAIIAVLATISGSGEVTANNHFYSGHYWLPQCEKLTDKCLGLVMGLSSGLELGIYASGNNALHGYCRPDTLNFAQELDIFVKYMKSHPQELHMKATLIYVVSMAHAFPCNK